MLVLVSGCTTRQDPENNGGSVIPKTAGIVCTTGKVPFDFSQDGRWLVFWRSAPGSKHELVFLDLQSDEAISPEPVARAEQLVDNGFGPDPGNICWSDNGQWAYFRGGGKIVSSRQAVGGGKNTNPRVQTKTRRRYQRYYYAVDISAEPLQLESVEEPPCTPLAEPELTPPPIAIRENSEKHIQIQSDDGTLLADHRPRGWLSDRIDVFEPDKIGWSRYYALSPNRHHLAYMVFETAIIGFGAPTAGYVLSLTSEGDSQPRFLSAGVYAYQWHPGGNLYACVSHSKYQRLVAYWKVNDTTD